MPAAPSPFDQARDELFQHVMRCGVVGADPEHVREWFDEIGRASCRERVLYTV